MQDQIYKQYNCKITENCKEEIKEFKKNLKKTFEDSEDHKDMNNSVPPKVRNFLCMADFGRIFN